MEEGGQHGAEQRSVEGGHTVVHHGQGVQAQAVVSGSGYQAYDERMVISLPCLVLISVDSGKSVPL